MSNENGKMIAMIILAFIFVAYFSVVFANLSTYHIVLNKEPKNVEKITYDKTDMKKFTLGMIIVNSFVALLASVLGPVGAKIMSKEKRSFVYFIAFTILVVTILINGVHSYLEYNDYDERINDANEKKIQINKSIIRGKKLTQSVMWLSGISFFTLLTISAVSLFSSDETM
jgi:1,4-dihydroxy-2-naphthoate octaprenyltransferase